MAKPARKKKAKSADITLEDLAAKFLEHLKASGKSQGTLFSYKLELVTALDELGKDTPLATLTPALVLGYFTSDRVMKTRTGVQKARPTFLKTQRVFKVNYRMMNWGPVRPAPGSKSIGELAS